MENNVKSSDLVEKNVKDIGSTAVAYCFLGVGGLEGLAGTPTPPFVDECLGRI